MLGTLSAPSGLLLSQVFPGTVVSPSPAAPLCWAFCLPPREPVGPVGLWAQGLGGRCSVPGASGVSAIGSRATDWVAGVGTKESGSCCGEFSKQLLSASFFSFSFWEIPPIQAPWSKQALGLSHSPAWLSPKNLAADPAVTSGCWAWGFSCSGPCAGPRDLIVLKHSPYCLIFQCPLQCLVSILHIC